MIVVTGVRSDNPTLKLGVIEKDKPYRQDTVVDDPVHQFLGEGT
jgi:hypothetical protein